jgi:hypothetical protein
MFVQPHGPVKWHTHRSGHMGPIAAHGWMPGISPDAFIACYPTGMESAVVRSAPKLHRRACILGLATFGSHPAFAWNFGTVRSAFTTVIRKRRDGPILSEWRSSEYRTFTILGMDSEGGHDDFRITFVLAHERKVGCELLVEKAQSEAAAFALWVGPDSIVFDPDGAVFATAAPEHGATVSLDRVLPAGSHRIEALWRGRRGSEIIGAGGRAVLTVTLHGL